MLTLEMQLHLDKLTYGYCALKKVSGGLGLERVRPVKVKRGRHADMIWIDEVSFELPDSPI